LTKASLPAGVSAAAAFMVVTVWTLLLVETAAAQTPERPAYKILRYEEDWSVLRDPDLRTDFFDGLKFLPLNERGDTFLSFGGEIRERYEYTHNPAFGEEPQDPHGVFLQRYVLHGDLRVGRNFRAFGQLFSALENGRAGGPSPVDENQLDVQQAFVDFSFDLGADARFTLRPGRQELRYGSGRLVDVREGPNVRRKFDGVRGILALPGWRIDAFATRPTEDRPGVFDDSIDHGRALWGVYGTGTAPALLPGSVDLYYLGFHDDHGAAVQGTEPETRQTIGARYWGDARGFDWNSELVYQWGRFGSGDIQAWTAALDTGYTFESVWLRPRVGLRADIASGDRDAANPDLQTFNPLFPRGNYFSELAVLGPRNFFDAHPFLTVDAGSGVTIIADVDFFWRQSLNDGVYAPNGSVLRAPGTSRARFVGIQPSLNVEWQIDPHLSATGIYSHFFPGRFIEETGASKEIGYWELTLRFVF
jgi:hypothetical protein